MKKPPVLATAAACSFAAFASLSAITVLAEEAGSPRAALVIKDSSITSSIRAQLASDTYKGLKHVDVDTDDHGVVTLKGRVPSQDAADRAISIARATDGVRTVKSGLKIKIDD